MPKTPSLLRRIALSLSKFFARLSSRAALANILMFSFILLCAVGSGMIFFPAGFIVAGIGCGVFGFLLGSE